MVFPSVQSVIVTEELRGDGTENSPYRRVLRIHSTEGMFLAENDPNLKAFLYETGQS